MLRKSEAAQWVGLARQRRENPIFQFLQLVSKRRAASKKWYSKGAPLIIGALPTLIFLAFVVYEHLMTGYSFDLEEVLRYAPLVFLTISYVAWAVVGLNLAIMDAMSLLRQSTKQSRRFELDDLACATSITDREFVAGFLGHILPQLYLRVVAGVGLGWLIMLLVSTEWFASFSNDSWTLIALSPVSIGLWSASGCVGVTALMAFYLALGGGRSSVPASMASMVVLGSQGIWLMMSAGLVSVAGTDPIGSNDNIVDVISSFAFSLLAPVLFIFFVVFGLRIVFSYPALKPIQAIGSPLLIPLSAMVTSILLTVNFDVYGFDSALYICLVSYIWHFGNMLPLNFCILADPVFYTGDMLGSDGGPLSLWYRPVTIILTQLALVYICLGYAKKAVGQRRQAS